MQALLGLTFETLEVTIEVQVNLKSSTHGHCRSRQALGRSRIDVALLRREGADRLAGPAGPAAALRARGAGPAGADRTRAGGRFVAGRDRCDVRARRKAEQDRKRTRLNSSH